MGQNERNAKSGTSVESCSLLLLTSLHFTTDIFSAKSRGVFVNILWTSCRRPPFVAATLSAFTVSQQRWDCDMPTVTLVLPLATFDQSVFLSPYPYYNFKSAFWPVFSKLFCRTKKERSALQTVHKKAAHKLLVPVAFGSAICYTNGVYTTRERKWSS